MKILDFHIINCLLILDKNARSLFKLQYDSISPKRLTYPISLLQHERAYDWYTQLLRTLILLVPNYLVKLTDEIRNHVAMPSLIDVIN